MSKASLPESAFIETWINPEEWSLPDEFDKALTPHIGSIPTSLFLPWPTAMLPAQGDELYFPAIVTTLDTVEAGRICYQYMQDKGIVAYVETASDWRSEDFNLQALHCFAQQGFLLEDMKPIKEVLEEAGLWQQLDDEYKD